MKTIWMLLCIRAPAVNTLANSIRISALLAGMLHVWAVASRLVNRPALLLALAAV